MKNRFLLLVALFMHVSYLHAQDAQIIKGIIKDNKTGEALIGATVVIKGTTAGAATDYDGNFSIKTSLPPPYILVITYVGYQQQETTVSDLAKPVTIKIEQNVTQLKEAEIRDSRISERQKQNPVTVETMDALAIKQTPAANFYEGLAHLKGVDLTSASIGFKIINTRGFNSTSPVRSLQLIDGVDNQSPGLNFSLGNFLGSSELDVQKVDLIVGASSAYYGPNAFNGVINMQTKSPFLFPGLSAQVKGGERDLFEGAVRWAQVFKNKKGEDQIAYKFNLFYMRANDWKAQDYSPTSQSPSQPGNAGGYDAVNVYGDENSANNFYVAPFNLVNVGRGYFSRDGYKETDLVDYNTKNTKLNAAVHYKVKKDIELIASSSFGSGTTVYQGDNRFSLKDILFFQNKLELRKEGRFFIRAYATQEDAGKSYDAYSTAIKMQNLSKEDGVWGADYNGSLQQNLGPYITNWYDRNTNGKGLMLDTIPGAGGQRLNYIENYWRTYMNDSLFYFHKIARNDANTKPSSNGLGLPRLVPGTYEFDTAFQSIISKSNAEGGSRFFDKSALYHIAGEYQFRLMRIDMKAGGNYRLYAPNSRGTIFLDTGGYRIYNNEGGAYLGMEKKVADEKVKISFTNRLDKNENFNVLWSTGLTGVYTIRKNVFRVSASSAVRNPTLADQYINLDVGRATLLGNLNGFDSVVSISSLRDATQGGGADRSKLVFFNVDPIQPEQVKTIELGYRTSLLDEKLYIDMNYYYSWYDHFIGYMIVLRPNWPEGFVYPERMPEAYRVATNAKGQVTTQGFSIGGNYFYKKYLGFSANYSWNVLNLQRDLDELIPAFNTPEHKYNLGLNGRDFDLSFGNFTSRFWGYGINYKHQTGFIFEGSPQYTGYVPAYYMIDAQVNKRLPSLYCTLKVGANNITNNKTIQVYGGPLVGRLAYVSLLFELDKWK
ncbi:MAG: carboxypeptidase-like regulatory domain-containing protein [Bacteroidota bacterium]